MFSAKNLNIFPLLSCRGKDALFHRGLISLLFLPLVLASCLRYVPSRQEIEESRGPTEEKTEFAGKEAFFSLEETQKKRLGELMFQRQAEMSSQEAGNSTYRIGPGDVLKFQVFDVDELNREVRVRPDGNIALPLIGVIQAKGLTEEDIQSEVSKRLEKYVYSPQVQIFIAEYGAQKISVIGEVKKPGAYPLIRENYSLVELLGEAGGRTDKASAIIVLIPASPIQKQAKAGKDDLARARFGRPAQKFGIEIYFDDLVGSHNRHPILVPLRAGDTVIVPEAGNINVDGEVNRAGSYQLSSRMSLSGAIASAGGLTYSADVKNVEVIRELGEGKKALVTVDLERLALQEGRDIRLRDGDLVRVPSAEGRFVTRQVVATLNSFFHFGVSGNMTP